MISLFNYLKKIPHNSSNSSGASDVNSDRQPLGFNLIGVTNLAKATFPILVTGSALLVATPTPVAALTVSYDNATSGAITSLSCSSPLVRTFNVTDNFTVQDVNLGFNADHTWRGDLRVTLQHPDGTSVDVISNTGGSADGYDVLLDSNSGNSLNDGDNDDTAAPLYDRTVAPSNSLAVFNGKPSNGTWTLEICDSATGDDGTFNSAQLILDDTAPPIDPSLPTGERPFSLRYSVDTTGNIEAIGNAVVTCDTSSASCTSALSAGTSGNNNGGLAMEMLDIDSDPSTFNSSSAQLTIPAGATVLFAGLYWGGTSDGATTPAPDPSKRNEALLATPGGGYQTITAETFTSIDNSGTSGWDVYNSFADVTSLVQAAGSGTYTMANVQVSTGTNFTYPNAGWALVIVYEDPTEPRRNLSVFDGYQFTGFGSSITNTLSGLQTPPTPGFGVFMGAVAGDGEIDQLGDFLDINGTRVSDGLNPSNNFFNGTISKFGSHITTRTPNDPFNLVFDIDYLDLTAWNQANNAIPTNATSIDVTLGTDGDGIWPMAYFFGVEVFEPNLVTQFEKTTPQTSYQNGDTIAYTISVTNTGNDNAVNTVITDVVPTGTTFVPGSLKINGVTKTDGATDEAEFDGTNVIFRVGTGANTTQGGQLNINETVTMSFEVTVTAAAGETVCNQASIDYEGQASGNQASGTSDDPNTATFGDCTEITVTPPTTTFDYGDAPDTTASTGNGDYQTLSANSGPSHTIDNSTYLGSGVTADTDGFGDGTDNNNNATDDTDDGVQLNSASLQGQTLPRGDNLTLNLTTAGSGVLNAWIDWNSDGDFDDSGEQIATDVSPTGNVIALNVIVPATTTIGTSYARFRYSSDSGLTPTGEASNGEVEDYQVILSIPEVPSPEAGNIVINEVLYAQASSSAETNDEFIELYNASNNPVNISNWKLADSNLLINDTDNTGNITGDAANPAYIFPNNTTLQPGEYAVIWIGNNTSDHQAADAAFQDWLGSAAKLNNAGEDIWLYDEEFKIVDYIAYGSNNAINTPPSAELNLWDDTYQGDLDGAATGQSISLTPNGEDGNTSACWEHTLSNDADGRCPEFLETRDTDTVSVRQTSVGVYNNILPNVILVKRITAIKPKDTNEWIDLPESGSPFIDGIDGGSSENNVGSERAADDNDPNWPNPDVYLRGLINSGQVMPGDELEYTVYFLSNGSNDAQNLRICDRVPSETTFIPDSFNATAGFPSSDVGIAMFQSTTPLANGGPAEPNIFLTNIPDSDRGRYYGPNTSVPAGCNVTFNQNGVVVVEVGDVPNADSPGNPPNSYGFIRFRALVK